MKTELDKYRASKTVDELKVNFAAIENLMLKAEPDLDLDKLEAKTIVMLKSLNMPTPGALAYRLTH